MPYFALYYDVVDDFVTRRTPFRGDHLARVKHAYANSGLILAGALGEPAAALLIFQSPDKSAAEAFAKSDPYVTSGLVKAWYVRSWNVVTGNEAAAETIPPAHPTEIVRTWSARATPDKWPLYREHFIQTVLPELRKVAGYLGANLLSRQGNNEVEIVVETFWRSLDAIRAFAGPDLENAVVVDEAAAALASYDRRVRHYEIAVSDRSR